MPENNQKVLVVHHNPLGGLDISKLMEHANTNLDLPNQIVIIDKDSKEQIVEINRDSFVNIPEELEIMAIRIEEQIVEQIVGKKNIEIRRYKYDVVPDLTEPKDIYPEREFKQAKRNNFKSPSFNFKTKRK